VPDRQGEVVVPPGEGVSKQGGQAIDEGMMSSSGWCVCQACSRAVSQLCRLSHVLQTAGRRGRDTLLLPLTSLDWHRRRQYMSYSLIIRSLTDACV
jgi:hypothetical protein